MRKKLKTEHLEILVGGRGSDTVDGVCAAVGVTQGGLWVASSKLIGSMIARQILGGPVGTALNIATIGCVGYVLYQ